MVVGTMAVWRKLGKNGKIKMEEFKVNTEEEEEHAFIFSKISSGRNIRPR